MSAYQFPLHTYRKVDIYSRDEPLLRFYNDHYKKSVSQPSVEDPNKKMDEATIKYNCRKINANDLGIEFHRYATVCNGFSYSQSCENPPERSEFPVGQVVLYFNVFQPNIWQTTIKNMHYPQILGHLNYCPCSSSPFHIVFSETVTATSLTIEIIYRRQ